MRAILGIGNPGSRYIRNRHNVGFQFLDYYADKYLLKFNSSKFEFYFAEGNYDGNPFILVKPTTYVNNSGIAAINLLQHFCLVPDDLLVIVDDIYLEPFNLRLRKSGGDGGHNGLSSIIYHLNSNKFPRLRVGIGNSDKEKSLPEYVLSDFNDDDLIELKKTFDNITILVNHFITNGYDQMLVAYSRLKLNK